MELYTVGGCVRDEIMGLPSKDIDFTVVFDDKDYSEGSLWVPPFVMMVTNLEQMGFKVFVEKPEYLTVRAQFPGKGYTVNHTDGFFRPFDNPKYKGLTADFVLARKESDYTDGRRPDKVTPGTLLDDLSRRDFTINAIAKAADGTFIDPFNGTADIDAGIIRAVGSPAKRLREDGLRALRALRFAVTKGMSLDPDLDYVLRFDTTVHDLLHFKVSAERKREELNKMFAHDTMGSIWILHEYPAIMACLFVGTGLTIEATMKNRK